jgi:hypothetical protein
VAVTRCLLPRIAYLYHVSRSEAPVRESSTEQVPLHTMLQDAEEQEGAHEYRQKRNCRRLWQ